MDDLMNVARREAERVMAGRATTRLATVTSYDPDHYAVKLALQPEGAETGWCPLASMQVGNGYGIYVPPRPGDMAVVVFQEDNIETPIVVGLLYNDVDRPKPVPAGEVHIVHEDGAKLILRPGGVVEIYGADIKVGGEGATFRRLVNDAFIDLFNAHQHGGSGPPAPQMHDGFVTSVLKGS